MRLVQIAGFVGSGKTGVIREICKGEKTDFIANNEQSAESLRGICGHVDFFPFKSPCARIRQYSFRVEAMEKNAPEVLITESPGNCQEVSAPMLNQFYINRKDIELGPLITVIDGRKMASGVSKRDSEGLRMYNMIDESDAVIVSFSDMLTDDEMKSIRETISVINEDAKVFFSSPGCDLSEVKGLVFGDSKYSRPLYN